jgi:hypothetical protein
MLPPRMLHLKAATKGLSTPAQHSCQSHCQPQAAAAQHPGIHSWLFRGAAGSVCASAHRNSCKLITVLPHKGCPSAGPPQLPAAAGTGHHRLPLHAGQYSQGCHGGLGAGAAIGWLPADGCRAVDSAAGLTNQARGMPMQTPSAAAGPVESTQKYLQRVALVTAAPAAREVKRIEAAACTPVRGLATTA